MSRSPLCTNLVVGDRQLDNSSRHLRRHRDDVGANRAIARPGRAHISLPHCPAERSRKRDGTERDDYWHDADAACGAVTAVRLERYSTDADAGRRDALRSAMVIRHRGSQRARRSTMDETTIM
jgi:hypothetical protein